MSEIINNIISGIILISSALIFAKTISNEKIKIKKHKFLILCFIQFLVYIISLYHLDGMTNTLVTLVIQVLVYKFTFRINYSKAIFLTFIYSVVLMLCDGLVMSFSIGILGVDKEYYYTKFAGSALANLSVCTLLLISGHFLKSHLQKFVNYELKVKNQIALLSVMTAIVTFIFFYAAFTSIEFNQNLIVDVGIIFTFLAILIGLVKQTSENEKLVAEYDNLLEYIKTYEFEIENQRILRHETKNQLITIKSKMIDKEEEKNVIKYIDSILDEQTEVNKEKYAKFQYLPCNGLKGLFYYKVSEAEKKDIKVSLNISKKIEKSILYDLTTEEFKQLGKIIGVYLDNAIEASSLTDNKQLGIEIYNKNEDVELIISNTYTGNIEKAKIGKVAFSTKGKNRGHGLMLINDIISKSEMFEQSSEILSDLYVQKLIIKKSIR